MGSAGHWRSQVPGQPLLLKVTGQPQDDQLLLLCHVGRRQKGIVALQTLVVYCPSWARLLQVTAQAWCGHQWGTVRLRAFALSPLLGVAAGGDVRTHG